MRSSVRSSRICSLGACARITNTLSVSCCRYPPYPANGCIPGESPTGGIVGLFWSTPDCSGNAEATMGGGSYNVSNTDYQSVACCPTCQ
jgi:hypothetical protein